MLPFIAGVAVGAVAVITYHNKQKVKETIDNGAKKVYESAKDMTSNVMEKIEECKSTKQKQEIKDETNEKSQ